MKKMLFLICALSVFLTSCGGKDITKDVRRCFMLPSENCCTLEINESKASVNLTFDGADAMTVSLDSDELCDMTKTVTADCVRTTLGELSVEDNIMNEPLVLLRKAFLFFGTQNYSSESNTSEYQFSDGDINYTLKFNADENRPVSITVGDKVNQIILNYK